MTAPTAVRERRGVIKPDPDFALLAVNIHLMAAWRHYRHELELAARFPGLFALCIAEDRRELRTLCEIRKLCRPRRIGGAS